MPLESIVICLDNSEWMRNGDYAPNRLGAQYDAVNMLCGAKIQSNPESTVGLLTMAGKGVQVLVSPTHHMGTLLNALHSVSISGEVKFANSIQVAQLALKHRRNKTGAQQILVFVGSPVNESDKTLVKIGKLLKKNNIGVHVICMGDIDGNGSKLAAFVDAANSNNNSQVIVIPIGMVPADVLLSTPVIRGDDPTTASSTGGGDTFAEYGGVDPSMDPELALALRVSMEEERARQEAMQRKAAEDAKNHEEKSADTGSKSEPATASSQNITQSASESTPKQSADFSNSTSAQAESVPTLTQPQGGTTSSAPVPASTLPFMDANFVNSLISGLPGVDRNDPRIQAFLLQNTQQDEKKEEEGDKKQD